MVEIFTKELKPCLSHSLEEDLLVERDSALIGTIHSAFSLNVKIRELTSVGLKHHPSTTTSHVRFVMKMMKNYRKSDKVVLAKDKLNNDSNQADCMKLKAEIKGLEKENKELGDHVKRLEGRLDSLINVLVKDQLITRDNQKLKSGKRNHDNLTTEN